MHNIFSGLKEQAIELLYPFFNSWLPSWKPFFTNVYSFAYDFFTAKLFSFKARKFYSPWVLICVDFKTVPDYDG